MARTYCIAYEIVTPESAEDGDVAERGFLLVGMRSYPVPLPDGVVGEAFVEWRKGQDFDVAVDPTDCDDYCTDPQPGDDPSCSESEAACRVMAKILRDAGASYHSPQHFQPGDWYSAEGEQDIYDGSYTSYAYHLDGWTPEEERRVCGLVHRLQYLPPVAT